MSGGFYKTGGNLALNAPSYIIRRADEDLLQATQAGEFCFILDSRQVGKSSLIVHAKQRLASAGVAVAYVELTGLGITSTTPEQWYDALLAKLGAELCLEDALEDFWFDNTRLAPLQRFMEALRQVVLERIERPIALFLDEIDVVRSLPFATDELFAGIRELYNRRTQDPALERLSICLIGVAQPTDLIQDPRITPFNIGRRIELTDFTPDEAAPLAQGLPGAPKQARRLLARVLYWTGGHPYLTQRLCRAVAEDGGVTSPRGVDRVCESLFFSVRARDQESNLHFVSGHLLRSEADRAALLDLYRQVRERRRLSDDPTNLLIGVLRLAGLVRTIEGLLWVRNRIYFRAFDRDWIQANLPDAEVRRQRAAYRRGALRVGLAAGVTIGVLVGGAIWLWDQEFRTQEEYYRNFTNRWGVPEGFGPLSRSEARSRANSFKFIRVGRANSVRAVVAVDAMDRCSPRHGVGTLFKACDVCETRAEKECRWEFVRDNQGQLVYEKAFDAHGKLVWGLVYTPSMPNEPRRAYYVGADGFPAPQLNSAAEIAEFEYTSDGLERLRRYFDRSRRRQPGRDAAYGQRHEYDEWVRRIRTISLDASDQPMVDDFGNAIAELKYDASGNNTEQLMLDAAGLPITNKEGWYRQALSYDRYGNLVEWVYFDTEGKPTTNKSDGTHRITVAHDEHGNVVEYSYFDTTGQPTAVNGGYYKAAVRYDAYGNATQWNFFDSSGQATYHKDGFHKVSIRYDTLDHPIEWAHFDTEGRPVAMKDGYHMSTARFDERGNQIEWAYFDTEGRPVAIKDGYHKSTARYDERGNQIEWSFFDTEGRPLLAQGCGYHRKESKYDEFGKQTEYAYFGVTGEPISCSINGYHGARNRYDEHGNQIEWAYFDTEGRPVAMKDGYHMSTARYDERGNKIESAYYDIEGHPTLNATNGVHRMVWEYDERGNKIRQAHFGVNGEPIRDRIGGVYSGTMKYDTQDHPIEIAVFDAQGRPMRTGEGYERRIFSYDEFGNKTEEFDYGFESTQGFESRRIRFDRKGNRIEWAYFDSEGRPTIDKSDGSHRMTARYDERGNRIESAYFDTEDRPMLLADGYHKRTARYDDQGRQIEEAFFDTDGHPSRVRGRIPSGYTARRTDYSPDGVEKHILLGFDPLTWGYETVSLESGHARCFDENGKSVATELVVNAVLPEGQAALLGIREGDVLTDYAGEPLHGDFLHFIQLRDVEPADGPAKTLKVRRGGKTLSFEVKPGKLGMGLQDRGVAVAKQRGEAW